MNKRWLTVGGILLAAGILLGAAGMRQQYAADVPATAAETVVSFTDGVTGVAFNAHTVRVKNKGANEVFVEWRESVTGSATAGTTGQSELEPGEQQVFSTIKDFNVTEYREISLICSAGETATVRVEAFR